MAGGATCLLITGILSKALRLPLTFSPACSSLSVGKWRDNASNSLRLLRAPRRFQGKQIVRFCPERNLGFDLTEIRVNETQNPK
ncbi:MAG: hypothetical protein OGMRLDGQ_002007 [Candidatus Fervidibacter sp.]